MARLKVYRTAIGFHDAYVATTSQKAALEAWGSDKNLFASGAAEVVTDPRLAAEPLASPGKIIRRSRGSLREHLTAAAKQAPPKREDAPAEPVSRRKPAASKLKPEPRPSREKLDQAEAAVAAFEAEAEAEAAEFERREADLREARKAAAARRGKALDRLEKQREQAKARYDSAVERWRASL